MTRQDYEVIAQVMVEQRPVPPELEYANMTVWQQGAYDEWCTIVMSLADTFYNISYNDRNGNKSFCRDKWQDACIY